MEDYGRNQWVYAASNKFCEMGQQNLENCRACLRTDLVG